MLLLAQVSECPWEPGVVEPRPRPGSALSRLLRCRRTDSEISRGVTGYRSSVTFLFPADGGNRVPVGLQPVFWDKVGNCSRRLRCKDHLVTCPFHPRSPARTLHAGTSITSVHSSFWTQETEGKGVRGKA